MCTPPMVNSNKDIPTVRKTKATARLILLLLEWKYFSSALREQPPTTPNRQERIISNKGSRTTPIKLMAPVSKAVATPKDMENNTSPTASSMATTINNSFVIGPSALYCFTTIKVAAGAVAAAMEPKVRAEEREMRDGLKK